MQINRLLPIVIIGVVIRCGDSATQYEAPLPAPLLVSDQVLSQSGEQKTYTLTQVSAKQFSQEIFLDHADVFRVDYVQSADTPPKIDILMVIDNSGSMWEEQTNLSTKMNVLLGNLTHTDWQINVITTDNPCPLKEYLPITPKTPDLEKSYADAINVGTWGSAWETGQQMLVEHLKGPSGCAGASSWLRKEAKFAVIIVSDETEDSVTEVSPDDVIKTFTDMGYKPGDSVKVYGFFWHPSMPKEQCPSAYEPPAEPHAELVEKTGGLWGSICAADYSATLKEISKDIGQLVKILIPLGREPAESTVRVIYNGQILEQGWMISGENLILRQILKPEDSISIEFQENEAKKVSLEKVPANGSLQVFFDKKKVDTSQYTYNVRENSLNFLDNLPFDTKITVLYSEKVELKSTFSFPLAEKGIVECYFQDEKLPVLYFKEDGEVFFATPPPEGSKVMCTYQ